MLTVLDVTKHQSDMSDVNVYFLSLNWLCSFGVGL